MIPRARFVSVLALAAVVACGCDSKPTQESVIKGMIDQMNEVATIQ